MPKMKKGIKILKRFCIENLSKFMTYPLIIINNGISKTLTIGANNEPPAPNIQKAAKCQITTNKIARPLKAST
jgi:hypothetical protein